MREVLNRPTPLKKQKRIKALRKFAWVIVIVVVLYFLLGLLSHLPRLNINEVETRGIKALDGHEVSQSILNYLKGNTALVYSRGNIFLYSKKEVVVFIQEKYPRVYRVNDVQRDGQKLEVDIEERQAAYVWCGHEAPEYVNRFIAKNCYFVDQKGFIFDVSPYFTDGVYLAMYGGLETDFEIIGQTIELQNSVEDIRAIVDRLKDSVTPIHSMVLKKDGQHEFLIDRLTSTGQFAKIIFNEDVTLGETLSKISTTLEEKVFTEEFAKNPETLEYIDTRFKNRVLYKFKITEQ